MPVRIDDLAENEAVWDAVMEIREQDWWVGATDLDEEGVFRWFDGGDELPFSAWYEGEPSNWEGSEHCTAYWRAPQWNDVPCSIRLGVICELPAE